MDAPDEQSLELMTFKEFRVNVANIMRDNCRVLSNEISFSDEHARLLAARYCGFFSPRKNSLLRNLPSKRIFLDYLWSNKANLRLATRAMEYWGGIAYRNIERREKVFNMHDITSRLAGCYWDLAREDGEFQAFFYKCANHPERVLGLFRTTTEQMADPNTPWRELDRITKETGETDNVTTLTIH